MQVALRTGFTVWLKAAGSVGVTEGFGAAAHKVAATAEHRKKRRSKESLRFKTIIALRDGFPQ
jgi:hypothetical protein